MLEVGQTFQPGLCDSIREDEDDDLSWQDVGCASIRSGTCRSWPTSAAGRESGCRSLVDRAWICWETPESESSWQLLVERLLPLSGVEIFACVGMAIGIVRASTCRPSASRSATLPGASRWRASFSPADVGIPAGDGPP